MSKTMTFPIKKVGSNEWLSLSAHGMTHEICAEKIARKPDLSFGGGHRVRLFSFRKNVHWLVPKAGQELDISEVEPEPIAPAVKVALRKKLKL